MTNEDVIFLKNYIRDNYLNDRVTLGDMFERLTTITWVSHRLLRILDSTPLEYIYWEIEGLDILLDMMSKRGSKKAYMFNYAKIVTKDVLNLIDTSGIKERSGKMNAVAYVDGCFNDKTGIYGSGVYMRFVDKPDVHLTSKGKKMAQMRNVAGEIEAVKLALNYAIERGVTDITIYYDYEGLEKWVTGEWQARRKETKNYVKQVRQAKKYMTIWFHHIKAHSGNKGNEIADKLAKQAAGILRCLM